MAGALPGIGIALVDSAGNRLQFGCEHGLSWARSSNGYRPTLPEGVCSVPLQLAGGTDLVATFRSEEAAQVEPLLRSWLDMLVRCEQLEQDMESMSHSSLQLLEQVAMLGETLPQLSASESEAEIAVTGIKACVVAAGVERAVYLRLDSQTGLCEVLAHVRFDGCGQVDVCRYPLDEPVAADVGLLAEVFGAKDAVVLRSAEAGPELALPNVPEQLARRQVMGVSVVHQAGDRARCLGALLLFDKVSGYDGGGGQERQRPRLGSEEGQIALSFASMLGAVIGARESAALGKELSMAQEIQSQILPAGPARVAGFDLAGDYRTSGDVGGDYFDYVPLADGRTLATVADVSGHNLASGMMMLGARATLRTLAALRSDPAQVFSDLGTNLFADLTRTERFLTAAAVALRPDDRTVEVVNAGHNPLMWYRAKDGSVTEVAAEQTVLGFLPNTRYRARALELAPGDCLLLYTDGVTEAEDEHGEMFGEERLVEVLRSAAGGSADSLIAGVLGAVEAFRAAGDRSDDITVVAIKAAGEEETDS